MLPVTLQVLYSLLESAFNFLFKLKQLGDLQAMAAFRVPQFLGQVNVGNINRVAFIALAGLYHFLCHFFINIPAVFKRTELFFIGINQVMPTAVIINIGNDLDAEKTGRHTLQAGELFTEFKLAALFFNFKHFQL